MEEKNNTTAWKWTTHPKQQQELKETAEKLTELYDLITEKSQQLFPGCKVTLALFDVLLYEQKELKLPVQYQNDKGEIFTAGPWTEQYGALIGSKISFQMIPEKKMIFKK